MTESLPDAARLQAPSSAPAFLVHNESDDVGVAVQDVAPGDRDTVYLDSDRRVTMQVLEPVPLGHKVALRDLAEGADIIEYGVRVGFTRQEIKAGQMVHIHNMRSARWQSSL